MTNIFKNVKPFIIKHEPEILMTSGLAGMVFSTIWAIKSTVKAVRLVDEKKKELNVEKLSKKEIIKVTWKCYLPVGISMVASVPCLIAGNRVSNKRNVALAFAANTAEAALQEYQSKTKEIIGDKKEQQIHEAISKEAVKKNPVNNVVVTGDGDSLFLEPITGRYFKSNWNKIQQMANELNADALGGRFDTITLSDWFEALGLEPTANSDYTGWSISDGRKGLIDISIDSSLTPDKVPCGAIYYRNYPKSL